MTLCTALSLPTHHDKSNRSQNYASFRFSPSLDTGLVMFPLVFIFATVALSPLTEGHQRDIACVAEIAVLADAQKRGVEGGADVQLSGRRWAGIVGDRIVFESGQPRELVAFAMQEAAKASVIGGGQRIDRRESCLGQMLRELADADADAAGQPLPKPVKAR